ncbi:MAG: helix-turn-helix domain-containing protein [Clostridia bacterium]|nr:helix-turn-helix domain-containing protein [Clostridia bacterium]
MKPGDTFQNRLSTALRIRNIKPVELHEMTGISESLLSKYLSGNAIARQKKLSILSDALDINPVWLMGYDVPMSNQDSSTNLDDKISSKHVFPLLGTVRAGYDYLASQNIIGYIAIDRNIPDAENCYALKVIGDSMQPVLYEDDIVIVHKQEDVESGQIGIVLIDNDEATVKKIVKYDNHIELVALNPYYPIQKYTDKDNFKIIGKVIEARITKIFE